MPIFQPFKNFYGKYERPLSSLSLVLGFVFDALTLRRADTFWENFWIIGHLVIITIFIILIHLIHTSSWHLVNYKLKISFLSV